MLEYKLELTAAQDDILKHIAVASDKTVQQILNEQAFFRVKEQLDQWIKEYLADVSFFSGEQKAVLDARLLVVKREYQKEIEGLTDG